MAKVDLFSPLTPKECVDRLRAGLRNPSKEIDGQVEQEWLRLRKQIFGHNSFQTFLRARLKPEGNGTRIRGSLGVHPFVIGIMAVWFAGIVVANVFILVLVIQNGLPPGGWFVPPMLLLFGIALIWVSRFFSRGQDRHLLDFVTSAVKAETVAMK